VTATEHLLKDII